MARFNKHLIHVSYAPCVPATLLYAIVHWLSFRRMSSYKKVILGKIHHSLSCLLNSLLVNVAIFSLPPSQFGGVVVVICCHTNKMWFTPCIWLSVNSRSDFPKLRVFCTTSIAVSFSSVICQCLVVLQFSTYWWCRPKLLLYWLERIMNCLHSFH